MHMPRARHLALMLSAGAIALGGLTLLAVALLLDVSTFGLYVMGIGAGGIAIAGAGAAWGAATGRAGQVGWSFVTAMILSGCVGAYAYAFANTTVVEMGTLAACGAVFVASAYGIHASRLARYDASRYGPRSA